MLGVVEVVYGCSIVCLPVGVGVAVWCGCSSVVWDAAFAVGASGSVAVVAWCALGAVVVGVVQFSAVFAGFVVAEGDCVGVWVWGVCVEGFAA